MPGAVSIPFGVAAKTLVQSGAERLGRVLARRQADQRQPAPSSETSAHPPVDRRPSLRVIEGGRDGAISKSERRASLELVYERVEDACA